MASYGKVVGGQFINARIDTNRKGELALHEAGVIFNKAPRLTADTVASWEELISETRGGAADAVSKVSRAVARAALPGRVGKATSAAVDSAASLVRAPHTVRVDWVDGKQSLIELPDKLFQHLAILLKDCQIATAVPAPEPPAPEPPPPPSVVETLAKEASQLIRSTTESRRQVTGATPAAQPDVTEQIAKLAVLRDQGALTEEEFAAKKAELLGRI
jgi:Short C-terminal domain